MTTELISTFPNRKSNGLELDFNKDVIWPWWI